ncbi:MAG: hypothetical protein PHD74_06760 [Candidatus Krumholzibacteria bacterium]|nr:hypothetical protein [Candidatus Krumholzibacteria bacterium]
MRTIKYTTCFVLAVALILLMSIPSLGAPATIKKSVQALEDGNYIIKMTVTASSDAIYAFELKDPTGSIVDVFASKGWCILSDGEVCLSRTSGSPITGGKSIEFVIHATSSDAKYVWTFFGPMQQIGKSEVL